MSKASLYAAIAFVGIGFCTIMYFIRDLSFLKNLNQSQANTTDSQERRFSRTSGTTEALDLFLLIVCIASMLNGIVLMIYYFRKGRNQPMEHGEGEHGLEVIEGPLEYPGIRLQRRPIRSSPRLRRGVSVVGVNVVPDEPNREERF